MFNETVAKSVFWLAFISYNCTFIPQFVMGSRGMPRRYHEYLPQFEVWHKASSYGSFVFGISLFLILLYLIKSWVSGEKAPHNPWGGKSMEWLTATPPIEHNFEGVVKCECGPYDFPQIEKNPNASH